MIGKIYCCWWILLFSCGINDKVDKKVKGVGNKFKNEDCRCWWGLIICKYYDFRC